MKELRQDGISLMTLTDLVDDFCLAQGNMRQQNLLQVYRHARWAWKEIFRKTMWEIRKAVLCVNCEDHTIKLPADCERVIAISVVDCFGKLHPLGFNTDWNTAKIKCIASKCSCNSCHGEDTLCAAIDTLKVVTETVVINGSNYTKTVLTRYPGGGVIQTQSTIPAWDSASSSVVYNTVYETICNVETTDKGCIKATPANMGLLVTKCGVSPFFREWAASGYVWGGNSPYQELIPAPYNYFGEWNYNAQDRRIVHIFSGATRHFNHTDQEEASWRSNIRQVVLDYQTNGETPDTEITIPEYAVEAVQIGMVYRQKYLHPKAGEGDKIAAKQAWIAAQREVVKYLNPVIMENVAKLQTNQRRW